MARKLGVYKCELCGNIVEKFVDSGQPLTCCNQEMTYLEEKTADHSVEKHVPFVEETENGYKVRVGENAAHPMTEEHYIQWIELIVGDRVYRQYLNPDDAPEAEFCVPKGDEVVAREYCNLHGHWKN